MSETLKTVEQAPSTSNEAIIEQLENETPQSRLTAAEAAVAALNINSSGTDLVYAHKGLQDAQAEMREAVQLENETLANEVPNYSGVDDLITVGKKNNTFHRPDGKFLSAVELKSINDNYDQIHDGIDAFKNETADVEPGNSKFEQPAGEGESEEEYVARHEADSGALGESAKIDTLRDVVVSPVSGEVDTLEGLVLSPVHGEKASADESSVKTPEQENTPEADNDDELDEEKKSIWNKVKEHTKDTYLKAGALFSTTLFTAGNFMPTPKQKFLKNESIDQFEARVRRYGTYKIVGVVALIVAAKYGLPLLNGGEAHASGSGSGLGKEIVDRVPAGSGGGGAGIIDVDHSAFSVEAHTVTRGEGWFRTFEQMKITDATEQANLLQKVGPQLEARGWAYRMDGGSWGISHTGQLPEGVLKLIENNR